MVNRKFISAACMLAFAVVLLHSAIPHSHQCVIRENHIHHLYNCGQLNTYLQSSDHSTVHVLFAAAATAGGIQSLPERPGESEPISFDYGCSFRSKPASFLRLLTLRGPPQHSGLKQRS